MEALDPKALLECGAAILAFVLGWLIPSPKQIVRSLSQAAVEAVRAAIDQDTPDPPKGSGRGKS